MNPVLTSGIGGSGKYARSCFNKNLWPWQRVFVVVAAQAIAVAIMRRRCAHCCHVTPPRQLRKPNLDRDSGHDFISKGWSGGVGLVLASALCHGGVGSTGASCETLVDLF